MPTIRKNTNHKPSGKAKQPKTVIKKTRVPVDEVVLPKKFEQMNEMLKKTTFLP